jgi:hypothetical protein
MRSPPQFRMCVTRRGDKEPRLAAFIAQSLAVTGSNAQPWPGAGILVIARSLQSPVVRAIGTLAREIAAAGCPVRMIVARPDRTARCDAWTFPHAALDCKVRLARDPRLIEAHEQLVLGPKTCWTGDSMRRDPALCDAYESFVDDCAETASAAATTFDRLWIGGEPLFAHA